MAIVKPIVFLDTETTGKEISNSRIVELACIKVTPTADGYDLQKKQTYINPGMPIPAEATEIHGITDEMVKNAPLFMEISKSLAEFLYGCDFGGHNIQGFDIPMLMAEFERCGMELFLSWKPDFFDTLTYERHLHSNELAAVYKRRTGKELEGAHGAMADTEASFAIALNQLEQNDITVAEIDQLCQGENKRFDIAGKFYKKDDGIVRISFGKHKDEPVTKLPTFYVNWFYTQDFPKESKDKLREALKK